MLATHIYSVITLFTHQYHHTVDNLFIHSVDVNCTCKSFI